jgi:hypothetical protein
MRAQRQGKYKVRDKRISFCINVSGTLHQFKKLKFHAMSRIKMSRDSPRSFFCSKVEQIALVGQVRIAEKQPSLTSSCRPAKHRITLYLTTSALRRAQHVGRPENRVKQLPNLQKSSGAAPNEFRPGCISNRAGFHKCLQQGGHNMSHSVAAVYGMPSAN